jgi:hypothetical protein
MRDEEGGGDEMVPKDGIIVTMGLVIALKFLHTIDSDSLQSRRVYVQLNSR